MIKKVFVTILIILPFILYSQKHWESIVVESVEWHYLAATSEPDNGWYQSEFDDSLWNTGAGGIGYSDNDDATVIDLVNSLYLRKKVTISDTSIIENLVLDIDYDDAFIFYLNGTEMARSSNVFDSPAAFDANLSNHHEAVLYQGKDPERYVLDKNNLIQGENTLAVHIINRGINSSDLSSRIFLNAEINSSDTVYQTTPDWFDKPINFDESNLPILMINTFGQDIPDEPKIKATMKVINNSSGINNVNDTIFEYDGYIGIETRGNTAQIFFDKMSYTLETRTELDSNRNVSLLGLPEENDWVLHGPYSDKSLMRNVLAYNLGNKTGKWSPRTKFCEVYLNDEYRGVFVFMEKIKIDKNRVDIATLRPDDNSGDELTGGYIMRVDRVREGSWVSPYFGRTASWEIPISYLDPKYDELTQQQAKYIRDYITLFEYTLASDHFKDPVTGYRAFIDVTSFVDLFIMTELGRDLDGYRVSVYFHKDKNSNGGKLNMSPLWDFNLAFGNGDFFEANNPEGWVVEGIGDGDAGGGECVFWWNRLLQDPYFVDKLKTRWSELRGSSFSNSSIMNVIDSCANVLSEAQQRNFEKFDILDSDVWPNSYIGGTYDNEINYMKQWITDRLAWMDENIPTITREYMDIVVRPEVDIEEIIADINLNVTNTDNIDSFFANSAKPVFYPNPFTENVMMGFNLKQSAIIDLYIYNLLGEQITVKSEHFGSGWHSIMVSEDEFKSESGIYLYSVAADGAIVSSGKLVKF